MRRKKDGMRLNNEQNYTITSLNHGVKLFRPYGNGTDLGYRGHCPRTRADQSVTVKPQLDS